MKLEDSLKLILIAEMILAISGDTLLIFSLIVFHLIGKQPLSPFIIPALIFAVPANLIVVKNYKKAAKK